MIIDVNNNYNNVDYLTMNIANTSNLSGQMYEDSIQELNNLIGELDSFQREHELKMKQKQREKQQQQHQQQKERQQKSTLTNGHDILNTTGDTTMTGSSIGDMSDIYNNFDQLSISSNDRNPLMCSTVTTSDVTFGSEAVDGINDLTDCQATTMSLKLNLSTTEHPLVMHSSCNSVNGLNGNHLNTSLSSLNGSNGPITTTTTVRSIELIPDSYNVSDDYVKEHTEIVVLRRKDSQNDVSGGAERSSNHTPIVLRDNVDKSNSNGGGGGVERISSFRCSSFAKTESPNQNDGTSTLKRGQSISSADSIAMSNRYKTNEYTNGTPVMLHYDQDVVDHMDNDSDTAQMVRQKPIITPRPASLSGLLFVCFFSLFIFFMFSDFFFLSGHFSSIQFHCHSFSFLLFSNHFYQFSYLYSH